MTGGPSTFETWRRTVDELERTCPWPGPRPFDERDRVSLLAGRRSDLQRFRREVDSHRLILLTGASGVGKTSLLTAGLVPELTNAGYKVAVCRDWGGNTDAGDPATYLARRVHAALPPVPGVELTNGRSLFWELEQHVGRRAVLVLDQFEELIRDAPARKDEIFELLVELNHHTHINVVISFRDEYLVELRPVENRAQPFTFARSGRVVAAPSYAAAVILAANTTGTEAITPNAANLLAEEWQAAHLARPRERGIDPFRRVGLLHLQALLYALHAEAKGGRITSRTLAAFRRRHDTDDDLFLAGLLRSIDVKLARCREAAEQGSGELDEHLLTGTTQALARSVKHLSSAGFKLVRDAQDLAETTLGPELEILHDGIQWDGERDGDWGMQLGALLTALLDAGAPDAPSDGIDPLSAPADAIAAAADAQLAGDEAGGRWAPRLSGEDPKEVTCGPMSGLAPSRVLIEELRRFAFAVAWLRETSLVRLSRPANGGLMVSLIHDGFGAALQRWSTGPLDGPATALHAITAPRGASFGWQFDRQPTPRWPELGRGSSPRVLANLRWRGAWVRASFRRVVFANCDFRGTFFDQCAFTGVTFLNCLLDGVIFSDCSIHGALGASPEGAGEDGRAQFLVGDASAELLTAMARHRGLRPIASGGPGGPGLVLLSDLAGRPASPVPAGDAPDATPLAAQHGGLVIHGGRVSSLVLRSCTGPVALRHVSGSGFDVVEQSSGRYEISASSLRHLTFTPEPAGEEERLVVEATDSLLAQAWFGDHARGALSARSCTLVHVWNGSPDFDARAVGGRHHGVVGVTVEGSDPMAEDASYPLSAVDPDARFLAEARAMDYRRHGGPGVAEAPAAEPPAEPAPV